MKDALDWQVKEILFSKKVAKETNLKPTAFWCHTPADPDWVSPFGKGMDAGWGVYSKEQKGYERADKRLPAFDSYDLEKAIDETKDEALQLKYYKLMKEYEKLNINQGKVRAVSI